MGDDCLAPAPCTCTGSGSSYAYIYCYSKSLNVTPRFLKADRQVSSLNLRLQSNQLTIIPNNAFKNLSSVNATSIDLDLSYNKIHTIDRYAFSGIDNVSTVLRLESNNLSSIPAAVYNHHDLRELYLNNNPLKSLQGFSNSEIGHTLQVLDIDLNELTTWPSELNSLKLLKTLGLSHVNVQHMNSEAFRGFENSLTSLSMDYVPNLDKIPNAVCQLSNLQSLILNHFSNLNENNTSIFDHCSKKLNKVTTIILRHNDLTKFPDIFHIFPMITNLYLGSNQLDIIESEKIPTNNVLSYLELDNNKFTRIPNALNRMKNLVTLSLQNNEITSIEDHDLNTLVHLQNLYLNGNPIKYISTHAFRNNNALTYINLYGTSLRTVPAAFMSLSHLNNLDLRTKDPIPCTCDLSYLKGWNATAIRSFSGACSSTGITIQNFIMTSLQHCP